MFKIIPARLNGRSSTYSTTRKDQLNRSRHLMFPCTAGKHKMAVLPFHQSLQCLLFLIVETMDKASYARKMESPTTRQSFLKKAIPYKKISVIESSKPSIYRRFSICLSALAASFSKSARPAEVFTSIMTARELTTSFRTMSGRPSPDSKFDSRE